jgi:hypothetical protein
VLNGFTIKELPQEEFKIGAQLLYESYINDPMPIYCLGHGEDHRKYGYPFYLFFLEMGASYGSNYGLYDNKNTLLGLCSLASSYKPFYTLGDQLKIGFFPKVVLKVGLKRIIRGLKYEALSQKAQKYYLNKEDIFLWLLSVPQKHWGNGYGAMMMDFIKNKIKETNKGIFAETTSKETHAWFQDQGFMELGKFAMPVAKTHVYALFHNPMN